MEIIDSVCDLCIYNKLSDPTISKNNNYSIDASLIDFSNSTPRDCHTCQIRLDK